MKTLKNMWSKFIMGHEKCVTIRCVKIKELFHIKFEKWQVSENSKEQKGTVQNVNSFKIKLNQIRGCKI